jgi:hypothetical protein
MSAKREAEPNLDAMKTLAVGVPELDKKDQDFAKSLCVQFAAKGKLSGPQWFWVEQLADRVECAGVPDFTKLVEKPATVQLGSFAGVIALFDTAKQHLKYPAITLRLPDGSDLRLAFGGPLSNNHGSVVLTDGKPYGQNKWYGVIHPNGAWVPGGKAAAIKDDLASILTKLAEDPARVAAKHGKLTGRCCFCYTKLSDPTSTAVGYGKVCALHYGLPWGG